MYRYRQIDSAGPVGAVGNQLQHGKQINNMQMLGTAMHSARDGSGEVQRLLLNTTFHPRLPGLTKMVSKMGKEGAWRKALEIYYSLEQTGVRPDTAITNAAISACDKGGQWRAALSIYNSMDAQGLPQDAITCSSVISSLAKGKQWSLALQVFDDMQARGILADVVTCCSLINALERGGQWQLAEQLFVQMCAASRQRHSTNSPFYRMMEIAAAAAEDNPPLHPSEGHPRDLNAAAPQGWGSPHQHAGIGSSPQTVRHPSTPQPRLVPPLQVTSPVQLSSGTNPQASLQSRFQSMPEFPATNFPRTSPARHVSDLQQQISNLSSDNSNSMLQFSLSTPDVTNFHNAQSSTVDADSFYSRPYQPHSTLSASSSRMRGSEGSLSSLQSQSSPLKFAPATPEKPSTPQQHVSDNLTSLMQDFASMQMQPAHLLSSQQCTHMPLDTSNSGPITEATLFSHATAKKFQEAAAQRQDTLSLRPTTHPVGHGQGPVLRFMNVTQVAPNRVCCNALLAAYARAKPTQWQKALAFLEVMQTSNMQMAPDTVTYNTVLKACCNADQLDKAMQVFKDMVSCGTELSATTFGTLMIAGANAQNYPLVKLVWSQMEQCGVEPSPACTNAYVQALVQQEDWPEAQRQFKMLLGQGSRLRAPIVTVNTIMAAYMKQGMYTQVQQVFEDMYTAGLQPNIMTYITLMNAYAKLGEWQLAVQLIEHMCQPQVAVMPNTLAFNHALSALETAASIGRDQAFASLLADHAVRLFHSMQNRAGSPPDANTYDLVIAVLSKVGADSQALHRYQLKLQQGFPGNEATLSQILSTCIQSGQWQNAYKAWSMMQLSGTLPSRDLQAALLQVLRDAHQWQAVLSIYQAMLQAKVLPDTAAANIALGALIDAGQLQASLSLVADMHDTGLHTSAPNCNSLVMLLVTAGQSPLALKVAQDMLCHGLALEVQALTHVVQALQSEGLIWKALDLLMLTHQASPSVKLQHKDYMALADWGLALSGTATTAWLLIQLHTIQAIKFYTLPTTASGGGTEPHSTSSITGVADIDPSATIMEADQHAVNLTGLHTKMAIAVVLSWAAQLSHCKSTASIKIVHTTISFILDEGTVTSSTSRVVSALKKLFRQVATLDSPNKTTTGTSRIVLCDPKTVNGRHILEMDTHHLYEWLSEHRDLLQKLHSGGEMPDLSSLLSEEDYHG